MNLDIEFPEQSMDQARIKMERHSQRLVAAFIVSGMFFMLLPGTFLGVWSLFGIARHHMPTSISPSWLQAHGQAQLFGWVGSFILGIGLYSLTKMQSTLAFPVRMGWTIWILWTTGISLRWIAGVTGWEWKILLPLSGLLQLTAFLFFCRAVRRHRPDKLSPRREVWMKIVLGGGLAFLITMIANFVVLTRLALHGSSPALPHVFDQQLVVLGVWGVIVPTIWGFNARWLPIFAGFRKPDGPRLLIAYIFSIGGIVAVFFVWPPIAATAFLFAALMAVEALHVWEPAVQGAKLLNVHATFPLFVRLAYGWLVVSTALYALAVLYDRDGGIWGASRHALTVGFIAAMVLTIGQRVLPAFCGMRVLWSTRLMLWSLLLLNLGCLLRVTLEPLAYEGYWAFAWKLLPVSAVLELTAIALFAINITRTLFQPPAHLRAAIHS